MIVVLKIICIIAFCVTSSYQQSCSTQSNRDISANDLSSRSGQSVQNCCSICSQTPGCKAYSWNDFRGGTCWLKSAATPLINKPGVTVGVLGGSSTGGSGAACWWSGCQLNTWSQKGCFPSDQWQQSNSRPCQDGSEYYCCPIGGSNPRPDPGSNPGAGQALVAFTEFTNAVVSNGGPQPTQVQYGAFIQGLPKGLISTKEEAAMALTQFIHESDNLKAKREYACIATGCPGSYADASCDAAGQRYFGRGYIQLSWCTNYRAASQDLLKDTSLVTNPDLVATNENLSWDTAFWFWKVNVHSKPGVGAGQFGATTLAINGALECGSGPNVAIARVRFQKYQKVRAAFSLSGPGPTAETGICSWYGADGEIPPGAFTASGAVFDRNAMSAAHKTLAFGTVIRVKNDKNGQTVDVTIDDRGPFVAGRIVDLTYAAFGKIAIREDGTIPCSYVIIKKA